MTVLMQICRTIYGKVAREHDRGESQDQQRSLSNQTLLEQHAQPFVVKLSPPTPLQSTSDAIFSRNSLFGNAHSYIAVARQVQTLQGARYLSHKGESREWRAFRRSLSIGIPPSPDAVVRKAEHLWTSFAIHRILSSSLQDESTVRLPFCLQYLTCWGMEACCGPDFRLVTSCIRLFTLRLPPC